MTSNEDIMKTQSEDVKTAIYIKLTRSLIIQNEQNTISQIYSIC